MNHVIIVPLTARRCKMVHDDLWEKGEEKKEEGESNEAVSEIVGAIISFSVDEVVKEMKEVVAA